jgi:hypothetical protein
MTAYGQLKDLVKNRRKSFRDFARFMETKTGWLSSPASTRFHMSCESGLLQHSVLVTQTMLQLRNTLAPDISDESCVIVGLFHDAGKAGLPGHPHYLMTDKGYRVNHDTVELSVPHRSLFLLSRFIELTVEEAQAILYHDGQYVAENAFVAHKECPLTLLVTFADTWSSSVREGDN